MEIVQVFKGLKEGVMHNVFDIASGTFDACGEEDGKRDMPSVEKFQSLGIADKAKSNELGVGKLLHDRNGIG